MRYLRKLNLDKKIHSRWWVLHMSNIEHAGRKCQLGNFKAGYQLLLLVYQMLGEESLVPFLRRKRVQKISLQLKQQLHKILQLLLGKSPTSQLYVSKAHYNICFSCPGQDTREFIFLQKFLVFFLTSRWSGWQKIILRIFTILLQWIKEDTREIERLMLVLF